MAEQHHRIKCPKCDHVQSASNSKCSNCGHSLAKARRAKFANLNESASPVAQALATQAFLFEAGFQEVLHPRARTGKFRGKLGADVTRAERLRLGGTIRIKNRKGVRVDRVATEGDRQFKTQHAAHATYHATAEDAVGAAVRGRATQTPPPKGKRSPGKLEGPFTYRSGWRGYYDPGEGRYLGSDDVYKPRGFDPHTGTTHEPLDAKLRREARAETARSDPAEEHQAEIARLERAIASHEKSRGTMIFSQRVLDQQKAELGRLKGKRSPGSPFFESPSGPMSGWTDAQLRRAAEGSPGAGTYSTALTREMRKRNKAREQAALEKFRARQRKG